MFFYAKNLSKKRKAVNSLSEYPIQVGIGEYNPHVSGENTAKEHGLSLSAESPPRTWEKEPLPHENLPVMRITPTYMGKEQISVHK